jgi:hypothetical protein
MAVRNGTTSDLGWQTLSRALVHSSASFTESIPLVRSIAGEAILLWFRLRFVVQQEESKCSKKRHNRGLWYFGKYRHCESGTVACATESITGTI